MGRKAPGNASTISKNLKKLATGEFPWPAFFLYRHTTRLHHLIACFTRERCLAVCHLSQTTFGRGRTEPPAIARVRAVRASRFERRIKCTRPPSPGRSRKGSSDLSPAALGRGDCGMPPLPNNVWERSNRASGDCSGEGRPSKPFRTPHQVYAAALTRTKPKGLVRPLPSCARDRCLVPCCSRNLCSGKATSVRYLKTESINSMKKSQSTCPSPWSPLRM